MRYSWTKERYCFAALWSPTQRDPAACRLIGGGVHDKENVIFQTTLPLPSSP